MFIRDFNDLSVYGFQIDNLFEIGDDHDTMRFYIYNDGLKEPVFHILLDGEYRDICICLFEARYYQYNSNKDIYGLLDLYKLDNFLRMPNKNYIEISNWELLVNWWISNNPEYKRYINQQPDYKKLEDNPIKRRSLIRMIKAKIYA